MHPSAGLGTFPPRTYTYMYLSYLSYVNRGSRWVSLLGIIVMNNIRHHNGYHIFGPCVCMKLLSCDYLHKYLRRLIGGLGTGQSMGHHNTTVVAGAEPKLMGPDHFFLVPPRTALPLKCLRSSRALFFLPYSAWSQCRPERDVTPSFSLPRVWYCVQNRWSNI